MGVRDDDAFLDFKRQGDTLFGKEAFRFAKKIAKRLLLWHLYGRTLALYLAHGEEDDCGTTSVLPQCGNLHPTAPLMSGPLGIYRLVEKQLWMAITRSPEADS